MFLNKHERRVSGKSNSSDILTINGREYRRGNQKMDSPEKLATQGTQDEEKQNKSTTQYVLDTTMHKKKNNNRNLDMSPPTNNWR